MRAKTFTFYRSGGGSVVAVKITDEATQTTDVVFSPTDGRVSQELTPKAYLLDVIIEMDNGDRYLYETVLAVLSPGQNLSQVNIQNIIQNFVTSTSSSSSHTTVVFEDDNDNDNNTPPEEEPSICYFDPNDPECDPDEMAIALKGLVIMTIINAFHMAIVLTDTVESDDDETGTCYPDDDIVNCDNGAHVLEEEDCSIYDPNPPQDPREVCFFEPNDVLCNPNEDGSCNEGFHHNDDEQCVPDGACPEGYGRLDDDETGKCYASHAIKTCPNGAKVLQSQVCPESEEFPNEPIAEADNDTSSETEPEPITCQEGFVLENGSCEPLTSSCGGIPCTSSEKENSTTSDPIPGPREDCTGTSTYNPETKQCEDIINPPEEPEAEPEPTTTESGSDSEDNNADGDGGDGNDNDR